MNYIKNCAICTSYLEILHVRKLESLQPSCVYMFCSVLIWWMWQYSPILLLTIWSFILFTTVPSIWTTGLSNLIDYTFATFCVMTIVWLMLQTRLCSVGIPVIHAFVFSPFTCQWKMKLVKILWPNSMNFQMLFQWTMDFSAENCSHLNFMCHFVLTHPPFKQAFPSPLVQSIVYHSQYSICPGISVISLWFC